MNNPPLLFCTGWATPPARLDDLMDHLAMRLVDYPVCFDFNPVPSRPGSWGSAYADALHEEGRQQTGPPILAGWSTGALIALETALHWPDEIAGLILINGTACFTQQPDTPHGTPVRVLDAMRKGLGKRRPERVLRDFFTRAAQPETLTPEALDTFTTDALAYGPAALIQGLDYLQQTDLCLDLHHLTLPVTILHGTLDTIIPVEAARDMADRLPNATLIEFPDDGHLLPLLDPRSIAGHIHEVLLPLS